MSYNNYNYNYSSSYSYGKPSRDKFYSRDDELTKLEREEIGYPIFGLINKAKSYNCFLNSILQSFWQIESFRKFFKFLSLYKLKRDEGEKLV